MSAREELQSLLNRYSYTVDSGDLAGFAGLYAKGEWYVEGTPPNRTLALDWKPLPRINTVVCMPA